LAFPIVFLKDPILNIVVEGDGVPECIGVDRSIVKLLGRWATPYFFWDEFWALSFAWAENPPCVERPELLLESL